MRTGGGGPKISTPILVRHTGHHAAKCSLTGDCSEEMEASAVTTALSTSPGRSRARSRNVSRASFLNQTPPHRAQWSRFNVSRWTGSSGVSQRGQLIGESVDMVPRVYRPVYRTLSGEIGNSPGCASICRQSRNGFSRRFPRNRSVSCQHSRARGRHTRAWNAWPSLP